MEQRYDYSCKSSNAALEDIFIFLENIFYQYVDKKWSIRRDALYTVREHAIKYSFCLFFSVCMPTSRHAGALIIGFYHYEDLIAYSLGLLVFLWV